MFSAKFVSHGKTKKKKKIDNLMHICRPLVLTLNVLYVPMGLWTLIFKQDCEGRGSSPYGFKLLQLSIMHDGVELFASLSPLRNASGAETFVVCEGYLFRHVLHKI